jgi:hypothetical protein
MRKDLPSAPQMSESVRANLSSPPTNPQEFSPWAQNLAELSEQRSEVRWQQGLTEGEARGEVKRFQAGEAPGEAKGRALVADTLLMVLRSRGVKVSAELEERIMTCSDPALLATWLQRVATVSSAAKLLAADGAAH